MCFEYLVLGITLYPLDDLSECIAEYVVFKADQYIILPMYPVPCEVKSPTIAISLPVVRR